MLEGIHIILNKHANICSKLNLEFESLESLIQNIITNNNININISNDWQDINIDYIKLSQDSKDSKEDSKFWNSGVGYGTKGRDSWNIQKYIQEKKVKINQDKYLIDCLYKQINIMKNHTDFKTFIINSNLFSIIIDYISSFNIVEIDCDSTFEIFRKLYDIIYTLDLLSWEESPTFELGLIAKNIKPFCNEISVFLKLNNNISIERKKIYESIIKFYDDIKNYDITVDIDISTDDYCNVMKLYQFPSDEISFKKHFYTEEKDNSKKPSKLCIMKLTKELATYHNSLPMNYESSIYVRFDINNLRHIKALIIGPKDTPYEHGCYIFDIYIPSEYPTTPPKVNLQTTGNGTVRFNPNLYNCGKVCLSLLGTWSGNGGEKWNKDTSTLLQVLVSIQSLILVENPYFNEPGYEREMHTIKGRKSTFEYNDNRRYNNIKWAINDNIEKPADEFKDVIINHYRLKKNEIINTINKWYSDTELNKNNFNSVKNKCISLLDNL